MATFRTDDGVTPGYSGSAPSGRGTGSGRPVIPIDGHTESPA